MNVQDIANSPPETWVGEFAGQISSAANMESGVSKCKLGDATGTIDVETWDHNMTIYDGKLVHLKGKGAIVKEYNGNTFLKLLKAAKLNVTGESSGAPQAPPASPAPAAPVKRAPAEPVDLTEVLDGMHDKYVLCGKTAVGVAQDLHEAGLELGAAEQKDIATTFFIELTKKGM